MTFISSIAQRIAVGSISFAVLFSMASPVFADRSEFTLKAPGVAVHQNKGWFGTKTTQYNDAIGNNYGYSKGVFGGESVSGGVLGAKASTSRSGILGRKTSSVVGPDGQVIADQRTSLFGKKSTTVDLNGLGGVLQNARNIFGSNNSPTPAPASNSLPPMPYNNASY
jgi:hypothetical protein